MSGKGRPSGHRAAPLPLGSTPVLCDRKAVSLEVGQYVTHSPHRVRVPMLAQLAAYRKRIIRIVRIKHQPPSVSAREAPTHLPKIGPAYYQWSYVRHCNNSRYGSLARPPGYLR